MHQYLALISGFLQKEESCFLPGIGVLKAERTSAVEEEDRILPPAVNVVFEPSATTAQHHIPDEIKKHFRLSSEEAGSEWKKIYNEVKKNAKPVTIPAIGELLQDTNGNIVFNPFKENEFYTAVSLPERRQATEEIPNPYEEEKKRGSILSWLIPVILLVLFGLGYFGYKYLLPPKNTGLKKSALRPAGDTASSSAAPVTDTAVTNKATDSIHFAVIYKIYHSRGSAEKYLQKMHNWGHDVSLYPGDSATFMLGYAFYELPADTAKRLEEVQKTYGGNPFIIYPGK